MVLIPVIDKEAIAYTLTDWLEREKDDKIDRTLSHEDNVTRMYIWLDKPGEILEYLTAKVNTTHDYQSLIQLITAVNEFTEMESS